MGKNPERPPRFAVLDYSSVTGPSEFLVTPKSFTDNFLRFDTCLPCFRGQDRLVRRDYNRIGWTSVGELEWCVLAEDTATVDLRAELKLFLESQIEEMESRLAIMKKHVEDLSVNHRAPKIVWEKTPEGKMVLRVAEEEKGRYVALGMVKDGPVRIIERGVRLKNRRKRR